MCVCPGSPFQPRLIFVGKVRTGVYPRVEYLKGASLTQTVALLTNIRLGWKDLSWANTLAYFEHTKLRP